MNGRKHVYIKVEYNYQFYTAEIMLCFHNEIYGQDADGNRGEIRIFIDDIEIINVIDENKNKVLVLTDKLIDTIIDKAYELDVADL